MEAGTCDHCTMRGQSQEAEQMAGPGRLIRVSQIRVRNLNPILVWTRHFYVPQNWSYVDKRISAHTYWNTVTHCKAFGQHQLRTHADCARARPDFCFAIARVFLARSRFPPSFPTHSFCMWWRCTQISCRSGTTGADMVMTTRCVPRPTRSTVSSATPFQHKHTHTRPD